MADIKAMGLYRNVTRIDADLAAAGITPDAPLRVTDLTPFDQYHYEGTAAVDDAAAALDAKAGSHILDIGSGLGGPARYMAEQTGCRVTALELQGDLHETATSLTERCGLSTAVTHIHGDVLAGDAPSDTFTGIMSMLCFLHIPNRSLLFGKCAEALQSGGTIFVDDYYARGALTAAEQADLSEKVYCTYLPDLATYLDDVEAAGFVDVKANDMTDSWTAFVTSRLSAFRTAKEDLADRYDSDTVASLDDFYASVAALFTNGRLGGTRIVARLS